MTDAHPLARKSPLPSKIVRDNSWIDREHNTEKWPAVLEFVDSRIAEGETSLTRVISQLKYWTARADVSDAVKMCIHGSIQDVPSETTSSTEDAMIYGRLKEICKTGPDALLDLGSGWGWRLFDLWNSGLVSPQTHMYSMEYTPVGRDCNARLLELQPDVPMTVHPFDFYSPDYSPVASGLKRISAFSVYSIYHVPHLKPDMFMQLLDLADEVDCIIFEPIGFQFRDTIGLSERKGTSQAHAERNDFNRNLWQVLKDMEQAGHIIVDEAEPDLVGRNIENALSYVRWHKAT